MNEQKKSITIVKYSDEHYNGYHYSDNATVMEEKSMVEVFALLISRLAATIQYDEDFGNNVEYKIEVTKRIL